jgi:hypothetical protein
MNPAFGLAVGSMMRSLIRDRNQQKITGIPHTNAGRAWNARPVATFQLYMSFQNSSVLIAFNSRKIFTVNTYLS